MDIISHYSAYTPAKTSAARQAGAKTPEVRSMPGSEFLEQVKKHGVKAPDRSKFLYNGSETRALLSDTEIAVLANKYDPHDMDQETYDAFLDDLQSMGAISEMEKLQLGYNGIQLIAYGGEDGELVWCGSPSGVWYMSETSNSTECIFTPWGEETDIYKWLTDRTEKELVGVFAPSTWDQGQEYENLLKGVLKTVSRMQTRREENAEEAKKADLVRQLADRNSEFYTNMRTTLKAQVKQTEEDEEEQAIVDALGAVLDALSGKKDVSGRKESVNRSATDLTKKIGDRIARLKREDPENPEIVKLENMLKRLQEMGIYFDLSDTDDWWTDEDETFETLTQFLTRRQAEEISKTHPNEKEVNQAE